MTAAVRQLLRLAPWPRRVVAAAVASGVLRAALVAPAPWLVQQVFGGAMAGAGTRGLVVASVLIVLLQAVGALVAFATRAAVRKASVAFASALRHEGLARVLSVPRARRLTLPPPDVHERLVHDTHRLDVAAYVALADVLPAAVIASGLAALLAWLDARLFLVALLLAPPNAWAVRWTARRAARRLDARYRAQDRFGRQLGRTLRRAELLRSHGLEEAERARYEATLAHLGRTQVDAARAADAASLLPQLAVAASAAAVLLAGALAIARGLLAPGTLAAFFAGLALLRGQAVALASSLGVLADGAHAARRLAELLPPEPGPATGGAALDFDGTVAARDVAFAYADTPVLSEVSLDLRPGRIVAVRGANGAGKTTLLRLVLGLVAPARGALWASGRPYAQLDLVALRRSCGVVPQEPVPLAGTLRENLTFGVDAVSDREIADALGRAGAAALVQRLPQGLDTEVGDDGVALSGGEAQAVAIARALVRRPRLLLLDEPTSHLDGGAVAAVLQGLRHRGPSVLVVTHDARVLACADEVLELAGGRLRAASAA